MSEAAVWGLVGLAGLVLAYGSVVGMVAGACARRRARQLREEVARVHDM